MARVCVHLFAEEDPRNKGYSLVEYDLKSITGLTLRKNHKRDKYELMKIREQEVVETFFTLSDAVARINQIEGKDYTFIRCEEKCQDAN